MNKELSEKEKQMNKYLYGIIQNQGLPRSFWLSNSPTDNPLHGLILDALKSLYDNSSVMSEELIIEKANCLVMKDTAGELWWNEKEEELKLFVKVAHSNTVPVSEKETIELFKVMQRERLQGFVEKSLEGLLAKGVNSEEDIDIVLEKCRIIKSVFPSATTSLPVQIEEAMAEASNSTSLIPYGIKDIDDLLGGLCRKEVTIWAGRPGHGKTSFACQITLNLLKNGYKVLFISKEMPTFRLLHKLFANIGRISSDKFKHGELGNSQELQDLSQALAVKYYEKLFIYDNVYDSKTIETLVLKHRPDVVIDDYIQLSKLKTHIKHEGIGDTMQHYKEITKDNNCAFAVLSQLSREIEKREDPRPRSSDLAASGVLEQVSGDICFIWYNYKVSYDKTEKRKVQFIASKSRYGESGYVDLAFDGEFMRYYARPNFGKGN